MIRGKYLRERKAMRTKRRVKFIVIVTIILIIYRILCDSFSLFESQATSNANIDIAFFLVNDQYGIANVTKDETGNDIVGKTEYVKSIKITDIKPGETKEYTIWVSNYAFFDDDGNQVESNAEGKNKKVADTNIEYTLNIKTTTNLPLEYKLATVTGATKLNTENSIERQDTPDSDGMYFQKIFSDTKKLEFNKNEDGIDEGQQDTYKLIITFPEEYKAAKYQDIIEYIEVSIYSEQIVNTKN